MYAFRLTQKCEYEYRTPEGNLEWQEVRDVNSWFSQAAVTFQRVGNVGYKASESNIIFSGLAVPQETDLTTDEISECPENYCVKVTGPAVSASSGNEAPALLYAFSHHSARDDFYKMMRDSIRSSNKDRIFLTNHFVRCGCESFCMDDPNTNDFVYYDATCYVEETCGARVFQIAYSADYPQDKKAAWASTGTAIFMDWFNECAIAMYGCSEHPDSDRSKFMGTGYTTLFEPYWKPYPKEFNYDIWRGTYNVYGLGGEIYDGFPQSTSSSEPIIAWTCPTADHQAQLAYFGDFVEHAEFARDAGLDTSLPTFCGPEIITPPEPPVDPPPVGPDCDSIPDIGYCNQMPGATCYIAESSVTCAEVDFVLVNSTSTLYFDDVAEWTDACLASGVKCERDDRYSAVQGTLLYQGAPNGYPMYVGGDASSNSVCDNKATLNVTVVTDSWAYENMWILEKKNADGDWVFYTSNSLDTNNHNHEDVLCIDSGSSYKWTLSDTYGDGLCSFQGCGFFGVSINGVEIATGASFEDRFTEEFHTEVVHDEGEWLYMLGNVLNNGQNTLDSYIYYSCESWEGAYGSKNFTDGAGDRFEVFGNSYGDLYKIPDGEGCTFSPTLSPSELPSISAVPSDAPSQSPTLCSESYLTSENLNIALVVDLSFSTYEKIFSSTVDIGDVNGDGKGNTILDAQIFAIQDLLTSIAEGPSLNNGNCEIELISFETDAIDHGKWQPLNEAGTGFNPALMTYIKQHLRAPTSNDEVFNTNNGFTNFDAALDVTVDYFQNSATANRKNLLVFLSDGEPNVRGDGDNEGYCTDTTIFWNGDDTVFQCSALGLAPGQRHDICRGNDPRCVEMEPLQDCVRGPNDCMNADAVTQYDSEINALNALNVERLAIGVGDESNIAVGSALWMIDDNPAKDLGVLPLQVLNLEELTEALSSLCILNTEPPTGSPSTAPSVSPTKSAAPSEAPSPEPSKSPTPAPSATPSELPYFVIRTPAPSLAPTTSPTDLPTPDPSGSPSSSPTTSEPSTSPTAPPSKTPSWAPTDSPTTSPSASPSGSFFPSSNPTASPTESAAPSDTPTASPSDSPSEPPTGSPSASPTDVPSSSPSESPTRSPSGTPTSAPTASFEPTYVLPDCYEGPKMVVKDSSDVTMCYYNQDMVQINEMNSTDVTVQINNVWTRDALPEQLRIFVHTDDINEILDKQDGEGFQCLNTDGTDVDIEGENELSIQCFQESPDAPWLAVVDVVITDQIICQMNDVPHPCFPDGQIFGSCSWRIVIPCEQNAICTEEPTSSPSDSPSSSPSSSPSLNPTPHPTPRPSSSPTSSPSDGPSSIPTPSPSAGPTDSPTLKPTGRSDGSDALCPEDIQLITHIGVTDLPDDSIRIVSQNGSNVTVQLVQAYTDEDSAINSWYYQYQKSAFSNKCYGDTNVEGDNVEEITIQCSHHNQIALLEFWVADDISNGVLAAGDNAAIPECCHPTEPDGTPVTKYILKVRCETSCPEVIE